MSGTREQLSKDQYTTELEKILSADKFDPETAMKLIRLGAHPDTTNKTGEAFLHLLVLPENNKGGKNNEAIKELVNKHRANIHIKNSKGYTPLKQLISGPFNTRNAMHLVRLGASINTTSEDEKTTWKKGKTLYGILLKDNFREDQSAINELKDLHIKTPTSRSEFLKILIYLVSDFNHDESKSLFKLLPLELIIHIFGFLDLDSIKKTQEERQKLAIAGFSQYDELKQVLNTPAEKSIKGVDGFTVLQSRDENNQFKFTFFHSYSPSSLCIKYDELIVFLLATQSKTWREAILKFNQFSSESQEQLKNFKKFALERFNKQVSLLEKPQDKQALLNRVKNHELYAESLKGMKFK